MNFELAKKQAKLGYLVAREKWNNKRCLFLTNGHLSDLIGSERPTFDKSRLTSDDVRAEDWFPVKLSRKGKDRVMERGYPEWKCTSFSKILCKLDPLDKG
jgi:hypothetical protein